MQGSICFGVVLSFLVSLPCRAEQQTEQDNSDKNDKIQVDETIQIIEKRAHSHGMTWNRADLERVEDSIGAFLASQPGVVARRTSTQVVEPVLRGLGGERVKTQVGIIPINGACPARMDPPVAYLFASTMDQLSLDFDTGSLSHGPAGMAGRIRIRADFEPVRPHVDIFSSRVHSSFHSTRNAFQLGANAQLVQNDWEGQLGFDLATGGDYHTPDGRLVPARSQHFGSSFSLARYLGKQHRLSLALMYTREQDVDHPSLPMNNDQSDFWLGQVTWRWMRDGTLYQIELEGGFSYVDHLMSNLYKSNRSKIQAETPASSLSYGAALRSFYKWPGIRIVAGLDSQGMWRNALRTRKIVASDNTFQDHIWPDLHQLDVGLFLTSQGFLSTKTTWSIEGRLDFVQTNAGALDDSSLSKQSIRDHFIRLYGSQAGRDSFAWWAGALTAEISWLPQDDFGLSLKTGWTQRAPTLTESHFAYAPAPGGYQVGNPLLHAEKRWFASLDTKVQHRFFHLQASVFVGWHPDFILQSQVESIDINADGTPDNVRGFRNSEALLGGGELNGQIRVLDWLSVPVILWAVHGTNLETDGYLPEIPPLEGLIGIRLHDKERSVWHAEISARIAAAQTFIDPTFGENKTPAFDVWYFRAGYRPASWFEIRLRLDNILDVVYHEHLTREALLASGDLLPGDEIPRAGFGASILVAGNY